MTEKEFRKLALSLPEAVEGSHMGHADFRVRGKIYATLGGVEGMGVVKLTPQQQAIVVADFPRCFLPVKGAWGERGYTQVILTAADVDAVRPAMVAAWRNTAPKRLAQTVEPDGLE